MPVSEEVREQETPALANPLAHRAIPGSEPKPWHMADTVASAVHSLEGMSRKRSKDESGLYCLFPQL